MKPEASLHAGTLHAHDLDDVSFIYFFEIALSKGRNNDHRFLKYFGMENRSRSTDCKANVLITTRHRQIHLEKNIAILLFQIETELVAHLHLSCRLTKALNCLEMALNANYIIVDFIQHLDLKLL